MPNIAVQRFLHRLDSQTASSFTSDQLNALDLYFGMRHRTEHTVDLRGRLRLPFLKIYFVFLAGRDQNMA
jgi:hypothetical protein